MTPQQILALASQVVGVAVPGIPLAVNAITALSGLFDGGKDPTQDEVNALIEKIKSQSAEIQKL